MNTKLEATQRELVQVQSLLSQKFSGDFTSSLDECVQKCQLLQKRKLLLSKLHNRNIPTTITKNSEFPHFLHTYFTAGDETQFLEHAHLEDSYSNVDVLNTFRYLFYKHKKAVYVKIRNGQLNVFLPFSNSHYQNEWSSRVTVHPKHRDFHDLLRFCSEVLGYSYNPHRVQSNLNEWYANGGLVRYEYPHVEEDTSVPLLHDMLSCVCKQHRIADVEFFFHKRDHPLIKLDKTEAFDQIFGKATALVSHNYTSHTPLLCFCTTENFSDLCIPTWEDWCIGSQLLTNKFFVESCKSYTFANVAWKDKKPVAIWRGSSTGDGVDVDSNSRLKLMLIKLMSNGSLDAGITKWNLRPRIVNGVMQTLCVNTPPLDKIFASNHTAPKLSIAEQQQFKYIVNVDGHVSSFRLSYELGMGSVILLAKSQYYLWYTKSLKPYVHYVPVEADLSDLLDKISWCQTHDTECQTIASNAKLFFDKYINCQYMSSYVASLLNTLADCQSLTKMK